MKNKLHNRAIDSGCLPVPKWMIVTKATLSQWRKIASPFHACPNIYIAAARTIGSSSFVVIL